MNSVLNGLDIAFSKIHEYTNCYQYVSTILYSKPLHNLNRITTKSVTLNS